MRKNRYAFTLIELLVTISIIGILSVIALVAVNVVRETGRDAKRKTDLETIRTALELYKADAGVYPSPPLSTSIAYGTKTYLATVPTDPSAGRTYSYNYIAASKTYTLCAALEGSTGDTADCSVCTVACTYKVTNP